MGSASTARKTKKSRTEAADGDVESILGAPRSNAQRKPRCLAIANSGVKTGGEFASLMSALMSDIIEGAIAPQIANAVVNAGGKLLKVTEMQLRYGKSEAESTRALRLVG